MNHRDRNAGSFIGYAGSFSVPTGIFVLIFKLFQLILFCSTSSDNINQSIFTDLIRNTRHFRGDFVMWLEIILIFPFFVFRKMEMF